MHLPHRKHQPVGGSDPDSVLIADILNFYMREKVEQLARPDVVLYRSGYLLEWWGERRAIEIKPKACRDYVKWRLQQIGRRGHVSESTARKDLEINRDEAARLLWAAWRSPEGRHLARFILIGAYSGTRPGAILKLRWLPSTDAGWVDLDHDRLYRKGAGQRETKKRQPARADPRASAAMAAARRGPRASMHLSLVRYSG